MAKDLSMYTAAELLQALLHCSEKTRIVEFDLILDTGAEYDGSHAYVPESITEQDDIEAFCAMTQNGFSIRTHIE